MTSWTSPQGEDPMDGHRRCTGTNRAGNRCGRAPVKGAMVCSFHGGKAPQVQRKATERLVEEQVRRAAVEWVQEARPITSPLEALMELAREITGFKDFIAARVAELRAESWRYEGEHAEQLRAEVSLYERALDRTAKVLVDINKLGLEEKRDRLAREEGVLMWNVITRVLDALDLSPAQRDLATVIAPRELRAVAGGEG